MTEKFAFLGRTGSGKTYGAMKFAELMGLLGDAATPSSEPSLDGEITYREQYGVIVICQDEAEQQRVFQRLSAEGLMCRVVVT